MFLRYFSSYKRVSRGPIKEERAGGFSLRPLIRRGRAFAVACLEEKKNEKAPGSSGNHGSSALRRSSIGISAYSRPNQSGADHHRDGLTPNGSADRGSAVRQLGVSISRKEGSLQGCYVDFTDWDHLADRDGLPERRDSDHRRRDECQPSDSP